MAECGGTDLWRRTWEPARVEPHPPPNVACRLADPAEVPRGASALARAAERAGWSVRVTYARGTRLGASGKPLGGPVDSICVRGRRDGEHFAATWVALQPGKYTGESVLYLRAGAFVRLGLRSLAERVKAPPASQVGGAFVPSPWAEGS